jgi:hypothetical protein
MSPMMNKTSPWAIPLDVEGSSGSPSKRIAPSGIADPALICYRMILYLANLRVCLRLDLESAVSGSFVDARG